MASPPEHFNVLIVGAGLSGIGAAVCLQQRCPGKSYAILEGRKASGGTWDLFRYPGVRSDSDMYTLGYAFRPWRDEKAIADGPAILDYVRAAAAEHGVDKKIRFNCNVTEAAWSTQEARWTVTADLDGAPARFTCNFLWMCSGYYRYDAGYTPDFAGVERFRGALVHPQKWPEDLDFNGKRVVVIGSGATAVTLVPALAERAGHVTMVQRSPSFIFSIPLIHPVARTLLRFLPAGVAYQITRWYAIAHQQFTYKMTRLYPNKSKKKLIKLAREKLPADYDVETHFTPSYFPWDQRVCLVPDDDLFNAVTSGRAEIVTDHIETFTEDGLRLKSGKTIQADIIVTATGLALQALGGANIAVDGRTVRTGETLTYKGLMFSDVPNLASVFGYTNASWTLRADLVSRYICRLLNYMDRRRLDICAPRNRDPDMPRRPYLSFTSGYVLRAESILPKQGGRAPWRHPQDYFLDMIRLRYAPVADGVLEFARAERRPGRLKEAERAVSVAAE